MKTLTLRAILVAGLAIAVFAVTLIGHAQEARRIHRVAVLHLVAPTPPFDAFRKTMRELGWVEGQTLEIDYRGADGSAETFGEASNIIVENAPGGMIAGDVSYYGVLGVNTGILAQTHDDDTAINISNAGIIYSGSYFDPNTDTGVYAAAEGNNGQQDPCQAEAPPPDRADHDPVDERVFHRRVAPRCARASMACE